jgi:hypothetical protein
MLPPLGDVCSLLLAAVPMPVVESLLSLIFLSSFLLAGH